MRSHCPYWDADFCRAAECACTCDDDRDQCEHAADFLRERAVDRAAEVDAAIDRARDGD